MTEFATLIPKIQKAFANLTYVGDENIIRDSIQGYRIDADSIYEAIIGKRWNEIDYDTASKEVDGLRYLTPQAFQYYLPGFLTAFLDETPDSQGSAYRYRDPIYWIFLPGETPDFLEHFKTLMSCLTESQKQVIVEFLRIYLESDQNEEETKRLRLYWDID